MDHIGPGVLGYGDEVLPACMIINNFRYLKWRVHPHRAISCMDTAYGFRKTHTQNSLIRARNPPF